MNCLRNRGWLGVLLLTLACGTATGADEVSLVQDGKALVSVVITDPGVDATGKTPPSGPDREAFDERAAADDLVRVVQKMTGVTLEVAGQPKTGLTPIYLGSASKAVIPDINEQLKNPDPLVLVNDRFLIDVSPQRVVLCGARAWATRLAVSRLLIDQGCRWYGGGEFFEVIPERTSLTATVGSTLHAPDFEMRNVWWVDDHDRVHLMLTRHGGVLHHGHSWHRWIGKERKERPELRGMVHGERVGPLEFTHPDVPDIFANNIIKHIDKTGRRTVSISTDDGPVYSQSKEAADWLITEWSNPFMATPAITDATMRLYNKFIPKVLEEKPDTVFGYLVYANTVAPPRYESVHPAIAIVGAPLGENPLVPTTSDDPRRSNFRKQFETWMKLAKRGYIYEYDPFVLWHGLLSPRVELIRRNIPYYASIGLRGMNVESRKSQFSESGLNVLVYSRLFWDNDADVDAVLDEFTQTFYGPAAGSMREWIRVTQESILNHDSPGTLFGNEEQNIELILTRSVMDEAGSHLAAAEQAAAAEPWKSRVHVSRLVHDKVIAYLDAKDAMDRSAFGEALVSWDRIDAISRELQAIDPQLSDTARIDLKPRTNLGAPWYGGVRHQILAWANLAGQADDAAPAPGTKPKAKADVPPLPRGEMIAALPEVWDFAFDPENLGLTNRWQTLDTLPGQAKINIGQPWDNQGYHEPRIANGWYRTSFTLPADLGDKPVHLCFSRLYGMKLDLFVDGQLVEHRDLPRWFWYDYNHNRDFDLTEFVTPGKQHRVTLRIFKEFDWGGPYGGIFLYTPTTPAKE